MKIAIGSDHGGIKLKRFIISHFKEFSFDDVGTYSEESCDYPDIVPKVAHKVQNGDVDFGIVICGTGIGASIVANKIRGIRAALCMNEYMAEMSRRHNNANILALGERVTGTELAASIVKRWLESPFDGDRHQKRIDKITKLENMDN